MLPKPYKKKLLIFCLNPTAVELFIRQLEFVERKSVIAPLLSLLNTSVFIVGFCVFSLKSVAVCICILTPSTVYVHK